MEVVANDLNVVFLMTEVYSLLCWATELVSYVGLLNLSAMGICVGLLNLSAMGICVGLLNLSAMGMSAMGICVGLLNLSAMGICVGLVSYGHLCGTCQLWAFVWGYWLWAKTAACTTHSVLRIYLCL